MCEDTSKGLWENEITKRSYLGANFFDMNIYEGVIQM